MTKVTDYIGNKVYEQGVLKKILVDGGYIEDGKYYFTLQDHLGNTRMVLSQDGSIVQREYYYPFGMTVPHIEYDGKHPYRYNGKELDQMHRLDLYDYSARYYDQAIGRFTTVDPLAEKYYSWSPYNYGYNNPLRYIDPTGEGPGDVVRGIGEGFVGTFKSLGHVITHPIETVKQAYINHDQKVQARNAQIKSGDIGGVISSIVGDAAIQAGDAVSGGQVSLLKNLGEALYSDIGGGDGSATGRVIGGQLAETAIAVGTAKAGQTVSAVAKEASALKTVVNGAKAVYVPKDKITGEVFTVTKEGIVLPKGINIPKGYIESPYRGGSYGVIENGKYVEKLRIDPATPVNKKGPNTSHFHVNGDKEHLFDLNLWPK